jgi:hypothetical protein
MNRQKVTEMFGALSANAAQRTPDCPADHEMAAVVAGQAPSAESNEIQLHIADCDFCIHQLGLLSRLQDEEPVQEVSEFVLARARRLGAVRISPLPEFAPGWAAAAVIVLAVTLAFLWNSPDRFGTDLPGQAPSQSVPADSGQAQSRHPGSRAVTPQILSPGEGASIGARELLIKWSEIPGSLYYDVRVVSDEGDVIWQGRVEDTESRLPESLSLTPGAEYFVRVDAYLAAAKRVSSRHVLFTVAEER